ncbi:MAG TPA: phosphate signaling complex protein PhoU [Chthonomonadaceae bacterium]|nr:phosphate signaling complex protein PhoU [Chthonomonadaceae bacterium]
MGTTRAHFDQEIRALQEKMLEMATFADAMLESAVESLMSGDLSLIKEVVRRDDVVDRFDLEIEEKCLLLIATQQPVARDLRIIGTALKVITDIERIADYAVDIAKIGRRLARAHEIYRPLVDLPRLAQLARAMLHDALQAFVHHDLNLVDKVIRDDDAVDTLYHQIRDDLTQVITSEPSRSLLALNVLFAAKYLERISDHVVNIAERVNFIETGELKQLAPSHSPTSGEAA